MKLLIIMLFLMSMKCSSLIAVGFEGDVVGGSPGDDVEVMLLDATTTSKQESERLFDKGFTYLQPGRDQENGCSEYICSAMGVLGLGAGILTVGLCCAVGPCGQ